jgi:trimeric autotransporter adhesin
MDLPKALPGERRQRTRRLALLQCSFSYLFLAALLAGCGASGSEDGAVSVSGPTAPNVSLAANPAFVPDNGFSTLSWSATGQLLCEASGGWSGKKSANGSLMVGPLTVSSVYTLTCQGLGGLTTQAVTVAVGNTPPPSPPTVSLAANPTSVDLNETTTLTWSSTNADNCQAFGDWSGDKATSGSESSAPLAATSTFTLVCGGAGGTTSQSVTVTVAAPPPPPAPTVSLSANPLSVSYNGSSTLNWSSTNATSCTASGAWSGSKATSGSQTRSSLTTTSTFILACTGAGGSASRSVTVSVAPPPTPTVLLSANPLSVSYNGSSTLNWSSTDTTSCTASGAWSGSKTTSGSQTRSSLTTTSTFTLTCDGPGGSASRSVTVSVAAPALPTVSLNANPTTVNMNGSSTLSWSTSNATSCMAGGAWSGAKPVNGSQNVGPLTQTSTFNLSCTGPGGTTSRPVTVTVLAANGTADLSWIAPTTNEDGSPLTLASFNVYKGTSPSNLQKITSVGAGQTAFTVTGLAAGTYYFAVTAVSNTGAESTFSNVGNKTIF